MPFRENKAELKTVLEHISDGILFIDTLGTIRVYNKTLSEMLSINEDLTGIKIFALPAEHPLREGIFRADKGFKGPYCWERNNCPEDTTCPGRTSQCCRCWILNACSLFSSKKDKFCIDCQQYRSVKQFLEKPREFDIGDKTVSVLSSFIELRKKNEIWEVIVFRDVTFEKLDAVIKLAGAMAHELRQPLQIITSCISIVNDSLPDDKEIKENFDVIKTSCYRMNNIIEKITHITRYKTKPYISGQDILDIDESSDDTLIDDRDDKR
ncbi:MAG: hypothetical protein HY808_02680 [Nitrospirae bacterium]|nr:hypothetical protein [Nitrospirota bacterium]